MSIRRLIRKRKRAYKKYKKTINNHYWEKYKHFRNNCVSEIREAKKSYYDNLERLLSTENLNSKLFWKTSKQVLNLGKNKTNIPTLIFNGEHADGDTEKANMLNDYFSSQTLINDQNKHLPHLDLITDKTLEYITISEQEVRDVLENLDTSKAHGPDHVSPHFLKEGAPSSF